jgi:hypothetical protein
MNPVTKIKLNHRNSLTYGFRLFVLSFLGFGFAGRNNLITERLKLKFKNLPKGFSEFTIIQISDRAAAKDGPQYPKKNAPSPHQAIYLKRLEIVHSYKTVLIRL